MQYVHQLPPGFSCVTTLTMSFLGNGYSIKLRSDRLRRARRALEVPLVARHQALLPAGHPHGAVVQPAAGLPAGRVRPARDRPRASSSTTGPTRDFSLAANTLLILFAALPDASPIGLLADLVVRMSKPATQVPPAEGSWSAGKTSTSTELSVDSIRCEPKSAMLISAPVRMLSCAANMHSVASEASSQVSRWFGSPRMARTNCVELLLVAHRLAQAQTPCLSTSLAVHRQLGEVVEHRHLSLGQHGDRSRGKPAAPLSLKTIVGDGAVVVDGDREVAQGAEVVGLGPRAWAVTEIGGLPDQQVAEVDEVLALADQPPAAVDRVERPVVRRARTAG